MFVTFEGGEGAGKSTQVEMTAAWLRGVGHDVVYSREPGSTEIGQKIRRILLSPESSEMCLESEIMLFMADRAQNIKEVVAPALRAGKIVLCDRFIDSTIAIQGHARKGGMEATRLMELNEVATGGLIPDITFYLDMPPRKSIQRALDRNKQNGCENSRMDAEALGFHQRVRDGFLRLANRDTDRIKVIDGDRGVNEVQDEIMGYLVRALNGLEMP